MNLPFRTASDVTYPHSDGAIRIDRWRVCKSSGRIGDVKGRRPARRLEPTPLRLFLLLADQAGHTVCREELMAATWNRQFISPDSLNTAIHQIRAALDDDARQPRILQTVPGIGYRLIAEVRPAAQEAGPESRSGRKYLAAAAGVALAAALFVLATLQTGDESTVGPVLAPTLSFSENPDAEALRHDFARQLETLTANLESGAPAGFAQGILLESSIHEQDGAFEAYVHALSISRDEVLFSRRIVLAANGAPPIPAAELKALKLALIEIGTPQPAGSLAGLEAADRAVFLRALYVAREDGYSGLMAASATFERLLESYPENLRLMMAGAETNLEIFERGSFSKERLARAQGLVQTALAAALPRTLKGDAQALLAQIHFLKDLDVNTAEAGFADALALSPGNRKARERYARLLRARGRFDAALREFTALASEYDDDTARLEIWRTHYYAGRYDVTIEGAVALSQSAKQKSNAMLLVASAHEANGDFEQAYVWLKKAYGQRNYQNDFMEQLEAAITADGAAGYYGLMLGYMLKAEANGASLSPARLAGVALAAEDIETAESYIAKALEARDPGLYTLRLSPIFKAYEKANPEQGLATRISAVAKS